MIELKTENKRTTANFSELSAIRMREVGGGRGGSLWHIELVLHTGPPRPFVSPEQGDRRATFKDAAPLAKAASMIMTAPVDRVRCRECLDPGVAAKVAVASNS
jgi:hypothetical protein